MTPGDQRTERRSRIFNLRTWKARILVGGGMATSISAMITLAVVFFNSAVRKVDGHIDERAHKVYNQRIEPVYRMAAETREILAEVVDSASISRALARVKADSIRQAYENNILRR